MSFFDYELFDNSLVSHTATEQLTNEEDKDGKEGKITNTKLAFMHPLLCYWIGMFNIS